MTAQRKRLRQSTVLVHAAQFVVALVSVLFAILSTAASIASADDEFDQIMIEQMYHSPFLQSLSIHDRCRVFPTWSIGTLEDNDDAIVSVEKCGTAFSYFPQTFRLFNGSSWEFSHSDLQWMHDLQDCMHDAQQYRLVKHYSEIILKPYSSDDGDGFVDNNDILDFWQQFLQQYPLHPATAEFEYPSMEVLSQQHQQDRGTDAVPPVAVIVENALHIREAETLQDLKQCLQTHHDHLTEHRPFGQGYDNGGNNCVFLGAFLQWMAPGVAAQIRQTGHVAWEHGGWGDFDPPRPQMHPYGYIDPSEAGIRTSGHLSYEGWEALGPHKDNDSLYTVLVMLSDPEDYDGGQLYMQVDRSGEQSEKQRMLDEYHPPMVIKPKKHSAVVFMADENTHQVLSIGGGDRQTVGTEFWSHGDVPFGMMRPSPDMWSNFQRNHDWWNFD